MLKYLLVPCGGAGGGKGVLVGVVVVVCGALLGPEAIGLWIVVLAFVAAAGCVVCGGWGGGCCLGTA